MLKIKHIPVKGQGTVATQFIPKRTVIETAPVRTFPAEQRKVIDKTEISEYYFVRPSEYKRTNKHVFAIGITIILMQIRMGMK